MVVRIIEPEETVSLRTYMQRDLSGQISTLDPERVTQMQAKLGELQKLLEKQSASRRLYTFALVCTACTSIGLCLLMFLLIRG